MILLAALVPTVVGFIWYNPKVFGNAWMKAADMTEEKIKNANMGVILAVSLILSIMLSFIFSTMVIHQSHIGSLFMHEPDFLSQMSAGSGPIYDEYMAMMARFEGEFRSFGHGALHGTIADLFVALPVLGINALFERKGFKYILLNASYWAVTLALMGGIICQWG